MLVRAKFLLKQMGLAMDILMIPLTVAVTRAFAETRRNGQVF